MIRNCPICDSGNYSTIVTKSVERYGADFSVVWCNNCRFMFTNPILTPEDYRARYEVGSDMKINIAKVHEQKRTVKIIHRWRKLYSMLDLSRPCSVLDYGCGLGLFLKIASAFNVFVTGYDINRLQTAWARSQGLNASSDPACLTNNIYDLVHCEQVLEHIYDPIAAMKLFYSILKDGGLLYIGVPNNKQGLKDMDLDNKNIEPVSHVSYFTPESLARLITSNGFCIIEGQGSTAVIARKL